MSILEEAKSLQSELVQYRRYLHEHAEIRFELPITMAYVQDQLKKMGYEPQIIGKSGVMVTAGNQKAEKTFLLRADMDALPIHELADLPYASQTGNMHACGHDLHTAMLLGAARLLKTHESELNGCVKMIFQPNEEGLDGARNMIEAGLLENPKVDAAMMVHVQTGLPLPVPSGCLLMMGPGPTLASADSFVITVQGQGGHGGNPQYTVDPLNAICHLHLALQSIIAREAPALDPAVLTIGEIHGGDAPNVIPDKAYLKGTLRAFGKDNREFIKRRIVEVSQGIANTFRASAEVEFITQCPSLLLDENLKNQVTSYCTELLGNNMILDLSKIAGGAFARNTGSEDFGFVSELVPTSAVFIATGSIAEGYQFNNHHPKALFDESPLYIGAAVYAYTAIQWLRNN